MVALPRHIDSTMMTCFRSCPRKFWLEFACGYRPPGLSIDLHAGACFALGLETVYREIHLHRTSVQDALKKGLAAFLCAWGDFEIPEWKRTGKTLDRVWDAISNPDGDHDNRGYFDVYSPLTDPVQPYIAANGQPTFEYTFAIPLDPSEGFPEHPDGGPFLYTGRFDMLGSYCGRPIVRDEKTTGTTPGERWAEQWDLRSQFLGYIWACQQCGIDVDTVCIRGIGILKTKIHHVEAIKPYSKFLVDRWYDQLRRDMWRIRRCYDEHYFDYNLGDACTSYGSCIFTRVCQSPNPESWLSEFTVRHWNPLDKNPAKETPA